jgi:hypothetical protein
MSLWRLEWFLLSEFFIALRIRVLYCNFSITLNRNIARVANLYVLFLSLRQLTSAQVSHESLKKLHNSKFKEWEESYNI